MAAAPVWDISPAKVTRVRSRLLWPARRHSLRLVTATAAPLLRTIGRTLLALLVGVAVGALLTAAYIYSSLGPPFVFRGLVVVSLYYGLAIAGFCIPLWLVLTRLGWDLALAAAALGFVATAAFVSLTYAAGSHTHVALLTYTVVPYGLCGAAAALATWWVGRLLRRA